MLAPEQPRPSASAWHDWGPSGATSCSERDATAWPPWWCPSPCMAQWATACASALRHMGSPPLVAVRATAVTRAIARSAGRQRHGVACGECSYAPGRIRTSDQQLRRLLLYPPDLRAPRALGNLVTGLRLQQEPRVGVRSARPYPLDGAPPAAHAH